jgi:polar amino acid transport system substrate-binding protein
MALAALPGASAVDIETVTARSNELGGNDVLGGRPARVTWIGVIGEGESVASMAFGLPEGSAILAGAPVSDSEDGEDAASIRASGIAVTLLEGKSQDRLSESAGDFASDISDVTNIRISLAQAASGPLNIRVEFYNVVFPDVDATYEIASSYTDGQGVSHKLSSTDDQMIKVAERTTARKLGDWLNEQPWVQSWNSVFFLKIFFNPKTFVESIPTLFTGWLSSLALVLVGFPLAIPIGLGFSFLRMSRLRVVRFFASIYVNLIRGTPLFLQMFIVILGLPYLGLNVDPYLLGILVLAVNSSAYLAEIFRAGIQSIHKGQFEASASLGMNAAKTMFFVIIPQTVRRVIPTATSEFILLYKDTSLLAALGVMEMMMFAKSIVASSSNMTPYVASAIFYLIITLPLTRIVAIFEKKLADAEGHGSAPAEKKKRKDKPLDDTAANDEGAQS